MQEGVLRFRPLKVNAAIKQSLRQGNTLYLFLLGDCGPRTCKHAYAIQNKIQQPMLITLRISNYPARNVGEIIRKWRLEQGLFQKNLDKMLGVDEMTIVNWETGKTGSVKKYGKVKRNFKQLKINFPLTAVYL